jgi:anti-anti-sigma factor
MIATRQILSPAPPAQVVTDLDGVVVTSVTRSREGTTTLVEVRGEIDVDTVDLLHSALATAIDCSERVCCDLSGVSLFSAAGCTALVAARRHAAAADRILQIRGARGITRRVVEITGLGPLLDG